MRPPPPYTPLSHLAHSLGPPWRGDGALAELSGRPGCYQLHKTEANSAASAGITGDKLIAGIAAGTPPWPSSCVTCGGEQRERKPPRPPALLCSIWLLHLVLRGKTIHLSLFFPCGREFKGAPRWHWKQDTAGDIVWSDQCLGAALD